MKNTTLSLMMCLIAAFAVSTVPVDAATVRTHEINFDMMVPCVGEIVHLNGPFKVSLTFAAPKRLRRNGEQSSTSQSGDRN
jgi:hypothetical protein